jgi:hypothetical protein
MLIVLAFALALLGCRRRRHRWAHTVRPPPPAPALFATNTATEVRLVRWVDSHRMLAPFFSAVDNSMAAISPDGTVHWLDFGARGPQSHETHAPCRFDPSRHALSWTLSPRIAIDGAGHACCVHDGDDAAPQGAYCANLRIDPTTWRRAHTPVPATGVGSGAGAIALFHDDLWCTRDAGAHVATSFRGDEEQTITVASCDANGRAVAIAGTRSAGGARDQTVRFAQPGDALALLPDAPRGEPRDARILSDGSLAVLLDTATGALLMTRSREGALHTITLDLPPALALGAWGDHTVLTRSGRNLLAVDTNTGETRRRLINQDGPALVAATRVGVELAGFGRDGAMGIVSIE